MSVRDVRNVGSSLSRIHQLPRLETINLTFHPIYGVYGGTDLGQRPAAVQESIFRALATSFDVRAPSELTSLSLHNLRTLDPPLSKLYHTIPSSRPCGVSTCLYSLTGTRTRPNTPPTGATSGEPSSPPFQRFPSTRSLLSRNSPCTAENMLEPPLGFPSVSCTFRASLCSP